MWRPSTAIAAFFASLAWAVGPAAAADDARFLEGLRARGLWELAEKHCADRLADPQIDDQRRAELTIELSRTLAGHALESPASPGLWQRAQRVVEDFAARHPRDPRLILVRVQGALANAAHGEAIAETLDASSEPEARDAARRILRGAIGELDELSEEIAAELRRRGRRAPAAGELSAAELQSLEMNVRVELAGALRHQGLSYAAGTADRIHALSRAVESLDEVLRRDPATPLVWSAALEEIACLRLLGEYPQAEQRLAALEKNEPPAEFAERLQAERIRLALARERVDEALSEAGPSGQRPPDGADLELARLEVLLAAWRRAAGRRDETETADWQRRAVEQARAVGRLHGARSMRRAETLLARTMADAAGPRTVELLAQAAASFYRGGQLDKAVAAYDRASKQARDQRQPAKAFELGLTAATIEKQRQRYGDALARYRALAHAFPEEPKAPEAHLLAIHCAARQAQAQDPPDLDEYERLLHQHVSTWPASRTASQAWVWLGRLAEHRRSWQDAIAALTHVKPEDPQFAEAVGALGRCYEAWFDEMHERAESPDRLADEALARFELVTPRRGAKPNAATRAAALAAARIWLKEMSTGALPAERLLRAALESDPQAPDAWRASAERLLVAALAAQGKRAQADELIEQLSRGGAEGELALFEILSEVRRRSEGAAQRSVAETVIGIQDRLLADRGLLNAATQRAVRRERAVTLAALGGRKEALAELQRLAQASPRDGATQEALATLLAAGDAEDLQAARAKWTEVATRSRPGTPRWFRAHLALAQAQLKLGQVTEARATIARVATKYPDGGGPGMKRRFDELSAEIERPREGPSRSK